LFQQVDQKFNGGLITLALIVAPEGVGSFPLSTLGSPFPPPFYHCPLLPHLHTPHTLAYELFRGHDPGVNSTPV